MLQIKRIYDPVESNDGFRILIDRLWPRGISKAQASIDMWLKDIAPTAELRIWFQHEPRKFQGFRDRYMQELEQNPNVEEMLKLLNDHPNVTLLFAARDLSVNHAVVLKDYLHERGKST